MVALFVDFIATCSSSSGKRTPTDDGLSLSTGGEGFLEGGVVDGGMGEVDVEERWLRWWFPLLEWGRAKGGGGGGGGGMGVVSMRGGVEKVKILWRKRKF